eukprot:gene13118-biopygen4382
MCAELRRDVHRSARVRWGGRVGIAGGGRQRRRAPSLEHGGDGWRAGSPPHHHHQIVSRPPRGMIIFRRAAAASRPTSQHAAVERAELLQLRPALVQPPQPLPRGHGAGGRVDAAPTRPRAPLPNGVSKLGRSRFRLRDPLGIPLGHRGPLCTALDGHPALARPGPVREAAPHAFQHDPPLTPQPNFFRNARAARPCCRAARRAGARGWNRRRPAPRPALVLHRSPGSRRIGGDWNEERGRERRADWWNKNPGAGAPRARDRCEERRAAERLPRRGRGGVAARLCDGG